MRPTGSSTGEFGMWARPSSTTEIWTQNAAQPGSVHFVSASPSFLHPTSSILHLLLPGLAAPFGPLQLLSRASLRNHKCQEEVQAWLASWLWLAVFPPISSYLRHHRLLVIFHTWPSACRTRPVVIDFPAPDGLGDLLYSIASVMRFLSANPHFLAPEWTDLLLLPWAGCSAISVLSSPAA